MVSDKNNLTTAFNLYASKRKKSQKKHINACLSALRINKKDAGWEQKNPLTASNSAAPEITARNNVFCQEMHMEIIQLINTLSQK